jgi:hypothetical protein
LNKLPIEGKRVQLNQCNDDRSLGGDCPPPYAQLRTIAGQASAQAKARKREQKTKNALTRSRMRQCNNQA